MEGTGFGKRFVALRKQAGLTQEQVADRLCVTKAAVSKWERSQSLPDASMLPKIAALFDITLDDLMCYDKDVAVTLEPIDPDNSAAIARILSTDRILHEVLTRGRKPMVDETPESVFQYVTEWMERTNSQTMVVRYGDEVVGTLSISHRDHGLRRAYCDYWLSSDYWGRGIGTRALRCAMDEARKQGFRTLCNTILKDNEASLSDWLKEGAEFEDHFTKPDRYHASITL